MAKAKRFQKNSVKEIRLAVFRKYKTHEEREKWFTKFNAKRRMMLKKLSEAQNHRCCYCGCRTWLPHYNESGARKNKATLEHLVMVSKGGTERYDNLVMACDRCNSFRGEIGHMKYFNMVQTEGARKGRRQKRAEAREIRAAKKETDQKYSDKKSSMIFSLAYLAVVDNFWNSYIDLVLRELKKEG